MVVIKRILCPVDLSDHSPHVVDRAVALAGAYGASICVLHVLPVAAGVAVVPFGPEGPSSFGFHPVDRDQVLRDLPRLLSLDKRNDVTIDVHVIEAPAAHKGILDEAERVGADLIVLGTHGRGGFDRLIFGSVAEKVLRTSPLPVLTVPVHVPDQLALGQFRRILYTTDFSPGSAAALEYAASLAQHAAAQLIAMHVVEPAPESSDPIVGVSIDLAEYELGRQRQAARHLRAAIPDWIRLGCDTIDVVAFGRPHVEILKVAAERQADLIVTSVHGRNAIDRLVFGSTTEQVLRRASCPVLTIRAAG